MKTDRVNIQICVQHVKDVELDQYGKVKSNESIKEERINIVADTLEQAVVKATGMLKLL